MTTTDDDDSIEGRYRNGLESVDRWEFDRYYEAVMSARGIEVPEHMVGSAPEASARSQPGLPLFYLQVLVFLSVLAVLGVVVGVTVFVTLNWAAILPWLGAGFVLACASSLWEYFNS